MELIRRAIQEEKVNNYEEALSMYEDGVELFLHEVKCQLA